MKGKARLASDADQEPDTGAAEEPQQPDSDESAEPPEAPPPKKEAVAPRQTPAMAAIRAGEDSSLKDLLDSLGPQGSFRIRLNRTYPKSVQVNGKTITTEGHLETYDEPIDEEFIRDQHGGGTYDLTVTTRRDNGSFKYKGHRTVKIAGDPKTERLPANAVPPSAGAPVAAAPETSMNKEVLGFLEKQLERGRDTDPALKMFIDQLREDSKRRDAENAQLRRELADAQNRKPPEDPIKDKILGSLIDGESGRVSALRSQHDSELRQLKEAHAEDIRRMEDRHDRAMAESRQAHEATLATIKASYEREIAALRQSHEIALATAKTTHEIQAHVLKSENTRLDRDNQDLRSEVRELREKKDKPILEQLKDLKNLKEAISGDEEEGKGGGIVQGILEVATNPAAVKSIGDSVGSIFGRTPPAQAQATAQAAATPQQQQRRQIVKSPDGKQHFEVTERGLVPLKRKPKVINREDGTQVEAPTIDAAQLAMIVSFLEQAFGNNVDPEVVAQSGRSHIPPDILSWIKANDTEQSPGVDLFMKRVANLPGTSPLTTQGGRNWLRKVGKALIGE